MSQYSSTDDQQAKGHSLALGLGFFSLALGTAQLLAPRTVARMCGVRVSPDLVRLYGLREIACGIGILSSRDPSPYLMARIGGDALDLMTLATAPRERSQGAHTRALGGLLNVAGVTALDARAVTSLADERARQRSERSQYYAELYSDRSGFPRRPDEVRGAAKSDGS
ncbi:hypothetical protein AWB77_06105 [Caballeronia fortuita]|uniref:Uncharacterized protein n=1 Tax=Caballeronia fortuita TaxID=1777138 RepID=A0A158E076_9BURK|nr:hypothetical protein [Caballeronia fortuita]SAL00279.1 hypothetical protein AWB77_06105 [Caballeronia fortuita]